MIACDPVRAVLVLSLLLAPVSLLVPCVYAVGFLVALVGLLFNPVKNVTPSSRSSGRDRQAARSPPRAPQSQRPWCWGPTLGSAVLLAFGPAAGLVFDALTLVARAGAVASATVPRPLSGDGSAVSPVRGLVAEVGEGFRVVRRDADLLATLAAGSVVYLAGVVWLSVDVSFVERPRWARRGRASAPCGPPPGRSLGGLAALAAQRRVSWKVLIPAGLAVNGAPLLWYALSTNYAWTLAASCVFGLGGSLVAVAAGSAMMLRSPRPPWGA